MKLIILILYSSAALLLAQVQTGVASFYGEAQRGRQMANLRTFNPDGLTCASRFYNLGDRLAVYHSFIVGTNLVVKSVVVTVTDRGPTWELIHTQDRVLDLSSAAFARLASTNYGLINVAILKLK